MEQYLSKIVVVIPALNPDERMVHMVKELTDSGVKNILIVDDGSTVDRRKYFHTCKTEYNCRILRHVTNFGKGTALKSAFDHLLQFRPDIMGTVTADCDGQHSVKDILMCAKLTYENPDSLILGCRTFKDRNIPLRSRLGNRFTCLTLKALCGLNVSDTQTGLRGMSLELLKDSFIHIKGERFEYEMNMLLAAQDNNIPVLEFPIETIYIHKNESSHFNPFLDSIRIYKVFLKFALISFSSFLIDILLFYLLGLIFRPLLGTKETITILGFSITVLTFWRSILSRLGSSLFNFTMNKRQVFRNDSKSPWIVIKYYFLCICQLALSTFLVDHLLTFITYTTVRKCIIDTLLFIASYVIQREWVFRQKNR